MADDVNVVTRPKNWRATKANPWLRQMRPHIGVSLRDGALPRHCDGEYGQHRNADHYDFMILFIFMRT